MNLARQLLIAATASHYRRFIRDTHSPKQAREELWQEVAPLLRASPYWQERHIAKSAWQLEDFDITEYVDYRESLEKSLRTGISELTSERILFWSESSATTGVRKHFPITKSYQKQFQRTPPPFLHSLAKRFPEFMKHPILGLAATHPIKTSPSGAPMGQISNFNYQNMNPLFKRSYALPYEALRDAETYQTWAPLYAIAQNLSAIVSITPFWIESLVENIVDNMNFYHPYITGEKTPPAHLPAVVLNQHRLDHLKKLGTLEGRTLKEIWPGLQFVCCWTSGFWKKHVADPKFPLGQNVPMVEAIYSATEGWMNIPLSTTETGGILHPGAHIVEFIEQGSKICKANLRGGEDLEVGKRYEVFLTTAMGLVRYRLRDVVECTGFLNRSPRIEFCHKAEMLLLEWCSIGEHEFEAAIKAVDLPFKWTWHFARNREGTRPLLVIDEDPARYQHQADQMHQKLMQINEGYRERINEGKLKRLGLLQVKTDALLKGAHAQTKPKIISSTIYENEPIVEA